MRHFPNFLGFLCLVAVVFSAMPGRAGSLGLSEYASAPFGSVLFVRHALAPGNGDPAAFRIDDCSTQRNLDEKGRDQARQLGTDLRKRGISFARVYSSEWCRCRETATIMEMGAVSELPGLNSFYQGIVPRGPTLAALTDVLESLPDDGGLSLMVTHFVTISAITGFAVGSGEAVAYDPATNTAVKIDFSR
jgi:broad specificity phosphatase PhoE